METVHSRETESFKSKIKNNPGSYAILLFPNWVNFFTNQPRKTLPTHGNVFHNGSNNIFRKKLPGKTVHPLDGKKRTPRKTKDFNEKLTLDHMHFYYFQIGSLGERLPLWASQKNLTLDHIQFCFMSKFGRIIIFLLNSTRGNSALNRRESAHSRETLDFI